MGQWGQFSVSADAFLSHRNTQLVLFFPCPVCYLYVCLIVCVHQVLSRNDVQSVKIPFSNKLIVVRPGIWPLLWLVATMKTVQIDWNFVITEE